MRAPDAEPSGLVTALQFTQSIAAAESAAEVLVQAGLRAEATHSGLDRTARRGVLSRFAAGALDVVSAPQILDEGVDVPAADTASSWPPTAAAGR